MKEREYINFTSFKRINLLLLSSSSIVAESAQTLD